MVLSERKFDSGTVEINYAVGPANGNPLVMLHGISNWWRHFLPILPDLCFRYHVHALDFRGCGLSGRTPGSYSVVDYAADVIAFIEANFPDPVDLLGHSLGAHVALVVGNAIPDRIRSIILEDLPIRTADGRLQGRPYQPIFDTWRGILKQTSTFEGIYRLLGESDVSRGSLSDRIRARSLALLDPDVLNAFVERDPFDGYDPETLTKGLACPTLLVQADAAVFARLEDPEAERMMLLNSRICRTTVAEAGHNVHSDQPEMLVRAISDFLESL
ncbi:MAG: alpha/beta hydrolase [Rhodospirillaceae bacterium]|nr:alpha/beta hydrolase [Rhodospirillaceae bacterium]MBT5194374.1 alpha/beta hydrolase [Rhodospirillaceae bacterium]MBT5896977.1 alpha/beta hydrolase [Rhodospirillaceae bacterium]MBT6429529.1 alpha/beta hydrolase [Rhodospirillaceae bacterium]MBT7756746.1 alpha/beta hydrolase [Rhodospirillaceae bacterium]